MSYVWAAFSKVVLLALLAPVATQAQGRGERMRGDSAGRRSPEGAPPNVVSGLIDSRRALNLSPRQLLRLDSLERALGERNQVLMQRMWSRRDSAFARGRGGDRRPDRAFMDSLQPLRREIMRNDSSARAAAFAVLDSSQRTRARELMERRRFAGGRGEGRFGPRMDGGFGPGMRDGYGPGMRGGYGPRMRDGFGPGMRMRRGFGGRGFGPDGFGMRRGFAPRWRRGGPDGWDDRRGARPRMRMREEDDGFGPPDREFRDGTSPDSGFAPSPGNRRRWEPPAERQSEAIPSDSLPARPRRRPPPARPDSQPDSVRTNDRIPM